MMLFLDPSVTSSAIASEFTRDDRSRVEFWRYYEGMNMGSEISKDGFFLRVCVIAKNNLGNGLLLIIPLTTKYHDTMSERLIHIDDFESYPFLRESRLILNQIKLIDKKRFFRKLECQKIDDRYLDMVKRKLIEIFV